MSVIQLSSSKTTTTKSSAVTLLLLLLVLSQVVFCAADYEEPLCVSETNVFTARVDLYAGELGYYVFEECGLDVLNPTLAMELGETYTFVQKHRTNYFHPIGFAYSPYGDEDIKLEVEPGTSRGNQECTQNLTCDAPMYYLNNTYLGHYSNNPLLTGNITQNVRDFGLDVYEPLFLRNPHEWTSLGTFNIKMVFNDPQIESDMFYFCHIHEFMGGRIKFTKNGKVLNELDIPSLGFAYDYESALLSEFDKECGTYALGKYKLPNPKCPDKFVCGLDDPSVDPGLLQFSQCIDAMNCHMLAGMTTGIKAQDERALFVHQMIPHHQNAVNMAKALLKTEKTVCEDLANDQDPDCILEGILYEIVNTQNIQIQAMYDYLDAKRMPEHDDCEVLLETLPDGPVAVSASSRRMSCQGLVLLLVVVGVVVTVVSLLG